MYSQLLVVVLMCVMGAKSLQMCVGRNPCRLKITMHSLNDRSDSTHIETESCNCRYPYSCSTDWSLSSRVISTNLYSTTSNMSLVMMFCSDIVPSNECNVGQDALVLSGYMEVPTTVNNYRCRCPSNVPMRLRTRRRGSDFKIYQTYVCDNHMPTCVPTTSSCMAVETSNVQYSCKCSGNLRCRVNNESNGITYGSCQP